MKAIVSILVAGFLAAATWLVPGADAQSTFPGPVVTVTALSAATAAQIIGANPSRRSIQICNVGASNPVTIWPGLISPVLSGYTLPPVTSNVTACFTPPTGLAGGMGAVWNGLSSSGTSVSVFEY